MSLPTRPIIPRVVRMTVTLYTRGQCCCCRSAREVLEAYREAHDLVLEEVDATDPAIIDRIGPTVPVISVDGKVRFRGEVNRVLLDRLIAAGGLARGSDDAWHRC